MAYVVQGPFNIGEFSGLTNVATGNVTLTTARNMLVMLVNFVNTSGTITLTSLAVSGEDVILIPSSLISNPTGTGEFSQIGYVTGLVSGGTKTITLTISANSPLQVIIFEVAEQSASPFDVAAVDTQESSVDSINLTTTADNDIIFVTSSITTATKPTASGAGYVDDGTAYVNLQSFSGGMHNINVGVAGLKTVTMGVPFSLRWMMTAAAFKSRTPGPENIYFDVIY